MYPCAHKLLYMTMRTSRQCWIGTKDYKCICCVVLSPWCIPISITSFRSAFKLADKSRWVPEAVEVELLQFVLNRHIATILNACIGLGSNFKSIKKGYTVKSYCEMAIYISEMSTKNDLLANLDAYMMCFVPHWNKTIPGCTDAVLNSVVQFDRLW